jgi:hypothetical protein
MACGVGNALLRSFAPERGTHTFNGQELIGLAGQVNYLHLVETKLDDATISLG